MTRRSAFALTLMAALAAVPTAPAQQGSRPLPPRPQLVELGRTLFFQETFGGNGRTCATCHDPAQEFTLSPAAVQAQFAADPAGPLFRALDSDDGDGVDFTTLLSRALFRLPLDLHPDVAVAGEPGRRSITVLRAAPGLANIALTGPYQWDGRKTTLQEQARGAVLDHFEPARLPSRLELDALDRFQRELFAPLRLQALLDPGAAAGLDPLFSEPLLGPSARRGRAVFEAHCGRCHGGPLRNRPPDPAESIFQDVAVSDRNLFALPTWDLIFTRPDGSQVRVSTPDPGLAAHTGRLEDLNRFEIPSLRGLRHTAPYFHDHSARTLPNLILHYMEALSIILSPAEVADLITYLETL